MPSVGHEQSPTSHLGRRRWCNGHREISEALRNSQATATILRRQKCGYSGTRHIGTNIESLRVGGSIPRRATKNTVHNTPSLPDQSTPKNFSMKSSIQDVRRGARPWHVIWLGTLATVFSLTMLPATSYAIEEPSYTTLRTFPEFEIRQYGAYTVAEVLVPAPASDAGKRAFPILAGYIFGKNKGERKLAMTAPVTQTPAPAKLEMTAPVTQSAVTGGMLVQFVLPKDINMENAPVPIDPRVTLREVPPKRVAVIRYSGFWSEANYDKHLSKLQEGLRAANIAWKGEPVLSRYDGPMTPWFMRRNEIWLNLD